MEQRTDGAELAKTAAKTEKPLHADHRARMQARVRRDGLESLAEHEALEYLLFFAIPRRDTNALAHRLIQRFGGFCHVLEASEEELAAVEGIGPGSARLIHAVLEFGRYYALKQRRRRPNLKEPKAAVEYVEPLFLGVQQELLYLVVMDDQYMPLRDIRLADGLPNRLTLDVGRAARAAVTAGGTCAMLAHNHPHGIAVPSEADINATGVLAKALGVLGIDLVDHIIVAEDGSLSLRATGRMPYYDPLRGEIQY